MTTTTCQCGHTEAMHIGPLASSCRIRGCECDGFAAAEMVAVRRDDLAHLLILAVGAVAIDDADRPVLDRLHDAICVCDTASGPADIVHIERGDR